MRRYRYTLLSILLAAAFILGSMVCMKFILQIRERQLLTESGKAAVESPVRAWQDWEMGEQTDPESGKDGKRYMLTTEQIENAILYWNDRTWEAIHEPVEGQISMEEAIEAGEQWLVAMGFEEDKASHSVSATLSVGRQKEEVMTTLEPYYSFWTVQLVDEEMYTVLHVNAVTGQVWGAKINLYENIPNEPSYEKLQLFVQAAGLEAGNTVTSERDPEGTLAVLEVKDSRLSARMGYSIIKLDNNTLAYYSGGGVFQGKYVVITYKFIKEESFVEIY